MRTLVTGGTGFVGSHLIEALLAAGHEVRALARSPGKARALELTGVDWVSGDLGDPAALERAAVGVELVFHVAGLIAARSELEYLAVNRDATDRLLRAAARAAGASSAAPRFVLVSSLAAVGPSDPGRPLQGDEPPHPVSAYGRSKLAGEAVVRAGPLPWTIVRPPAVYGPRDRAMLGLFRAASRGFAPVFGDGSQELSLIYGPDLATALVQAGTSPAGAGRTYFASPPDSCRAEEVIAAMGRAAGRRVRLLRIPPAVGRGLLQVTGAVARLADRATILNPDKGREFFQPAWTCSPAALQRDTGWRAAYDLTSGIEATWQWYRANRWL